VKRSPLFRLSEAEDHAAPKLLLMRSKCTCLIQRAEERRVVTVCHRVVSSFLLQAKEMHAAPRNLGAEDDGAGPVNGMGERTLTSKSTRRHLG
jgi:hypothetical protein